MKDYLKTHWKALALAAAAGAATAYLGPAGGAAVKQVLPVLWCALLPC